VSHRNSRRSARPRPRARGGPHRRRGGAKPILRAVLSGGVVDKTALREDYVDELLEVGRRSGYPTVARAVYANLPSLIAARSRYSDVTAPVHLIYGEYDWSRPPRQQAAAPRHIHIALERPDVPAKLLNAVAAPEQPWTRHGS